jgi:glucose/arabinose dehydrogenase
MRLVKLGLPLVAGALALLALRPAVSTADKPAPKRTLWTTSKIKGTPEPPPPYRLEVAFPKVKFFEPIEMTSAPGTDRLFVATRPGKIYSFDPKTQQTDLLADLKKVVYGLAFHPDFAKNGYFYATIIVDPSKEQPKGTRVSRFVAKGSPPKADLSSEKVIFEWPNGGHNGGCLRFGPDGYLYIATGDGSGVADQLETGQDVSDLLASMLRIDVDKPDGE